MIENIDRQPGIYQDRLRGRGQLENTIVVYSSDHGEMLGDHDRWGKSVPHRASTEGFFERTALFDREADPLETENIADRKPGEAARLGKLFAEG